MRKERQQELLKSIADLDNRYALTLTPELYKEKLDLQTEFNLTSTREAERLLLRSQLRGTYLGDIAGCFLAYQLKNIFFIPIEQTIDSPIKRQLRSAAN